MEIGKHFFKSLNNFAPQEGNNTIFLLANIYGVEASKTYILSALKRK